MFVFGNTSPDGTTREGDLGEEYAGVPTIRAKRMARQQLGTLAAALSAEPKVCLVYSLCDLFLLFVVFGNMCLVLCGLECVPAHMCLVLSSCVVCLLECVPECIAHIPIPHMYSTHIYAHLYL